MTDWLPDLQLPELGREAKIDVYLIHNSPDPEDYFFLFDFEQFVERSKGGMFVRPTIQLFSGRDDFSRTQFARQFRQVFAAEFDQMRDELAGKGAPHGWISLGLGALTVAGLAVGGVVAHMLLSVAMQTDKRAVDRWWNRPSKRQIRKQTRLENEIEDTKNKVEEALSRITVNIHPELYEHAYRGGPKGRIGDMDREAWPLPAYVRAHLSDGKSGSWW